MFLKTRIINTCVMDDLAYLRIAVDQAKESVKQGGFPAGAVLVKDGKIVAQGVSIGNILHDPTAHAESVAVRSACKALSTTDLSSATLYASLEPCVMCFNASNWANVSRIVFGCRKTAEMVNKRYYEGKSSIQDLNKSNTHQVELVFIPDFENTMLEIVRDWERQFR